MGLQWEIENKDERHVWSSACGIERTAERIFPGPGSHRGFGGNHGRRRWDSARFASHRGSGLSSGRSWSRGDGGLRHRWRIRTYRRKEGATPLFTSGKEAGKTRRIFILQSTLYLQIRVSSNTVVWGLVLIKCYFLGLVAIVYKMQAKQRKPLPQHFFSILHARTEIWKSEINKLFRWSVVLTRTLQALTFQLQAVCWNTMFLSRWGLVNVNIGLALGLGSS